jgi:glycosyltransferase involved in cell wall biosynthesis
MFLFLDNIIFSLQNTGGISIVWSEILKRIIINESIDTQIIEFDNAKNNFFRKQINIDKSKLLKKKSILLIIKRYFDINFKFKEKYIFHSSYYRLAKGNNVINVTTVHDFTYEYFFTGLAKKIHSWQKGRAIKKSNGIICISESTKRDLLRFYPNTSENKIRVIYNGVDKIFKKIDINESFDKKHQFNDFEYAIYVGDHKSKYKNFEMAVEACKLQNIKLLIIGGGKLVTKDIRFLNSILGFENYKSILNVTSEDLNQYYNRAYCLLYPSAYEGFGIPVVEAQKAGCPVIATYSSSIPEVIADIFLAIENPTPEKVAKKMEYLKLDSKERETIIKLGTEKSSVFNWDKTYYETIEFYKHLYNN